MRKHQNGVTFIGWVVLLIPVAILVYACIRLVPIYLNHMKVVSTIEQVAEETRTEGGINPVNIRRAIARRLDIESVTDPTPEQITVSRDGDQWAIEANYERIAPLFANINLLLTFEKRVVIQ